MIKDIEALDAEIAEHPEMPMWQILAKLGWIPPTTWHEMQEHTHDLEKKNLELTKPATQIEVGEVLVGETISVRRVKLQGGWLFVLGSDGQWTRFHEDDQVRVLPH